MLIKLIMGYSHNLYMCAWQAFFSGSMQCTTLSHWCCNAPHLCTTLSFFLLITEQNNQNTFQQQEIVKKNTVCACVCTFIEHVCFFFL